MSERAPVEPLRFLIDARTAASAAVIGLLSLVGLAFVDPAARSVVLPAFVTVNVLLGFAVALKNRDGYWPVSEIGTVCLFISGLYAIVPLAGFWLGDLRWSAQSDSRLFVNPPTFAQIEGIGWRYTLYLTSFAAAYLWHRDRRAFDLQSRIDADRGTQAAVLATALLFSAYFLLIALVFGVSQNPSYADVREGAASGWEGLPRVIRQIASYGEGILLVSKLCLLAILFQKWERKRWRFLLILWLASETLSAASRMGARRDTAMLLLAAVLLFHRMVRPLSVWQAALGGSTLLAALLAFGFARDLGQEAASWTTANEFQILFGNACDLQTRRAGGLEVPWQIHLADLLRLVPSRWQESLPFRVLDPSDWYLDVIGQRESGVGLMFGVVAQGVVGWDWPELGVRGALLGFIFATIHRWYVPRSGNLWATALYVFLCVWSYYTVRSTTFHIVYFVIYRFTPALGWMWLASEVLRGLVRRRSPSPSPSVG